MVASALHYRLIVFLFAALLAFTPALQAGDALSTDERARMLHSAATIEWPRASVPKRTPGQHALGVQTLAIEMVHLKGDDAATPRRARLYQYDHRSERARRLVLALDDGQLLGNGPVASVHLPLNAAERDWVEARLEEAAWLQDALGTTIRALRRTLFVFEPVDANDVCSRSRCALVTLATADDTVLAIEPVVEFATGRVRALDSVGSRTTP